MSQSQFDSLLSAVGTADRSQLDGIAKAVWSLHAAGALDDVQAQAIAEAVHRQRSAPVAATLGHIASRIATGSRPRRPEHLGRRRTWAASGWLPPRIAAVLTPSQAAVMAVIASKARSGRCDLCNAAVAALAGVSVSTVKNAKRAAAAMGLIVLHERPISRDRNLSTVVEIAAPEWRVWIAFRARGNGGGGKSPAAFQYPTNQQPSAGPHRPAQGRLATLGAGRASRGGQSRLMGKSNGETVE